MAPWLPTRTRPEEVSHPPPTTSRARNAERHPAGPSRCSADREPPKTAASVRRLELPPSLAARLWALGADATGPVLHTRTGRRLSARNLARTLETARGLAGVPGVTHHTFRHPHGSMLLDEGWTIAEVAERLGHADPSITAAVHTHRMRDRRRELGFLDDLGTGPGGQQLGNATPVNSRK